MCGSSPQELVHIHGIKPLPPAACRPLGALWSVGREADAPQSCRPSIPTTQKCQRPKSMQVPARSASNCMFLLLSWGGREGGTDAWPPRPPSHVPPTTHRRTQPSLTSRAAPARSRRWPSLLWRPRSPAPAPAVRPPAPPSRLARWCWQLACGCKARGAGL